MNAKNVVEPAQGSLPRRSFVTRAGLFGLSAAAAAFLPGTPLRADSDDGRALDNLSGDTAQEIFTAGPGLTAYSLQTALANAGSVSIPAQGGPPAPPVYPKDRDHDW
jgi:hypothetical protein